MPKKIVEEVVDVPSEELVLETTHTEEVAEPVLSEPVAVAMSFLHTIRGKEVVSVEFGEQYISVKDSEGTGYTLPRQEYLDLLACE